MFRLEEILNEYKKSLKEIPPPLSALFKEHVDKVEEALSPGLRNITWISVKIEDCKWWICLFLFI